jgi:hypothetical protein
VFLITKSKYYKSKAKQTNNKYLDYFKNRIISLKGKQKTQLSNLNKIMLNQIRYDLNKNTNLLEKLKTKYNFTNENIRLFKQNS